MSAYLNFFVKALTMINMWPQEGTSYSFVIKQYYVSVIITITTFPIIADIVAQSCEEKISYSDIIEDFVALSALCGVIYVSICFINKKKEIKTLVKDLGTFENYSSKTLIEKTDKSVEFYTRLFILYGIVGNACYGLLPVLDYNDCQKNKSNHMVKYGIPCGLVIRFLLPFKFDYFPLAELTALYECGICMLISTVIILITMLICGILLHTTKQLKYFRMVIIELTNEHDTTNLEKKMKFCVKFHTTIVDYATRTDDCFTQMMLLHITWTGFVISILGFEITTTSNYIQAVRFLMHLLGWLGLLFLVCYYGQNLMDESLAIADAIYSFHWYQKDVIIQKYVLLILLRSQKPLTLKAGGMKVMSLAAFLAVMYSAYSYFTLLLKLT